jgi:hypothetical protein
VGQFERERKEISRKGAKTQRKTLSSSLRLCAFAGESFVAMAYLNFKPTHCQPSAGPQIGPENVAFSGQYFRANLWANLWAKKINIGSSISCG